MRGGEGGRERAANSALHAVPGITLECFRECVCVCVCGWGIVRCREVWFYQRGWGLVFPSHHRNPRKHNHSFDQKLSRKEKTRKKKNDGKREREKEREKTL